jgi:hypothetical protein
MKPGRKSAFGRFFSRRPGAKRPADPDERREALVLLAIALLFLANVVLYLCHHYGLTSLNVRPQPSEVSVRVMLD